MNSRIAPHLLRVAETRAKARALRDMTNIAMVAVDELGGEDHQQEPALPPFARELAAGRAASPASRATDSQRRALWRKAQALGHDHRTVGAYLATRLGVELTTMSKQKASNLLNELQKDLRALQTQGNRAAE